MPGRKMLPLHWLSEHAILPQVVTQIRKKKHLGFSNSLDIVWKGKRDTFTSFLKRDNAHKILRYAWSKST